MEEPRYMLDTNIASYIIKGASESIRDHLIKIPMANICISAITEAELLHGLAKKPSAKRLSIAVKEFLLRVEILPWDSNAAKVYANLRCYSEKQGRPLCAMDLLIAAHCASEKTILVTNDTAFNHVKEYINIENWA